MKQYLQAKPLRLSQSRGIWGPDSASWTTIRTSEQNLNSMVYIPSFLKGIDNRRLI